MSKVFAPHAARFAPHALDDYDHDYEHEFSKESMKCMKGGRMPSHLRNLRHLRIAFVGLFAVAAYLGMQSFSSIHEAAEPRFASGAESIEALVDGLLVALASQDERALHQLRVSENEYRNIIIPGSADPGRPLRSVSEKPAEFFWRLLDTKSRDFARMLLGEFGGRRCKRLRLELSEGVRHYALYDAHGQVRLTVEDEHGAQGLLRTGWVAEVGDRYKLIGFEWDD